jgi:peptidyl-prolyl cis-trans isomerase C
MKIRDTYPLNLFLWLLVFLSLPGPAGAGAQPHDRSMVAENVSLPFLEQDLLALPTFYLNQLMEDSEKRREYIGHLYTDRRIEAAIVEEGLAQSQALLQALRRERARILRDALVRHEIGKSAVDIGKLARERYTANPDQYRTPKKIKLAIIFVRKEKGKEEQAEARMKDIVAQLEGDPGNEELFHELAKEYSDDRRAKQGGINRKWLIAPSDLEKRDPLMQAAFAMDRVGQVTDIVETKQGFAIAKLMAVTPAMPIPFNVAKKEIQRQIQSELYAETEARLLKALQAPEGMEVKDALVKETITKALSSREPDSAAGEDAAEENSTK